MSEFLCVRSVTSLSQCARVRWQTWWWVHTWMEIAGSAVGGQMTRSLSTGAPERAARSGRCWLCRAVSVPATSALRTDILWTMPAHAATTLWAQPGEAPTHSPAGQDSTWWGSTVFLNTVESELKLVDSIVPLSIALAGCSPGPMQGRGAERSEGGVACLPLRQCAGGPHSSCDPPTHSALLGSGLPGPLPEDTGAGFGPSLPLQRLSMLGHGLRL